MSFFNKLERTLRFYRYKINRFFSSLSFTQDTYLLVLGSIVGVLGGLGGVVFHELIRLIKHLFFDAPGKFFGLESLLNFNNWYEILLVILIPSVGGLLVGVISHYFEKGDKSEGIPAVIEAVASKGGVIKGSVAVIKTILSALSIGTGGAGGKEGPIVQIGSSIGSAFGRYLSSSPEHLRILVGCGAASGLAAAYNAPLGGALFAMEIILRTFNAKSFSPIIVASVFGTAVSRNFLGNEPAFNIPKYELVTNYELFFYIILGFLAAGTVIYYVKTLFFFDNYFSKLKMPGFIKPAVGGLFVGIIGIYLPGIYGFSYSAISDSLLFPKAFLFLFLLLVFKPIATGFTIGSGGNGGTFTPSLFTGAMLGGCFGILINKIFPGISAPPGAYALVGMGAVVAGTTNASLTALVMVFEMTNNYKIILPLMLTIIIATVISKAILKGSLYTLKFDKEGRGIDIYGRKVSILKKLKVETLIEEFDDVVTTEFPFKSLLETVKKSKFNNLLVVDSHKKLLGQISFQDIRNAILDDETRNILYFLVAGDLMSTQVLTIAPNENGEKALQLIETNDMEYLPVVDQNDGSILGIISKENILKRYQSELLILQSEHDLALG